jgi:uncharacterized membrane protein
MYGRPAHRHTLWALLVVVVLAISLVIAVLYLDLAAHVFRLLGLSPVAAAILLVASLVGSMMNIPLTRSRIELVDPELDSPYAARRPRLLRLG